MDENANAALGAAFSGVTPHTDNWASTSTYDVYMVDTLKDPPRRRRPRRRPKGTGRGNTQTNNMAATTDGPTPDNVDDQGNGNNATPAQIGNRDPKDPKAEEKSDYLPEFEEDVSLGPQDFIVPEDPYEQEGFRQRLAATTRSIKKKQQQLLADQNTLNDKCIEMHAVDQDLEARCEGQAKSYQHRHLLLDLNNEVAENVPIRHDRADQPNLPSRGRE